MRNLIAGSVGKIFNLFSPFERKLICVLHFTPNDFSLYKTAFVLQVENDNVGKNNERLEFLGDSVLGLIVTDFLFKKYSFKNEGFLSEMKSKIVNRQTLTSISKKLKLHLLLPSSSINYSSCVLGNVMEALIGAIYLDKGYDFAKKWIYTNIISVFIDLSEVESIDINIKNTLYKWANKNNKIIEYKIISHRDDFIGNKLFVAGFYLDGVIISSASGYTKKEAENNAARAAYDSLLTNDSSPK